MSQMNSRKYPWSNRQILSINKLILVSMKTSFKNPLESMILIKLRIKRASHQHPSLTINKNNSKIEKQYPRIFQNLPFINHPLKIKKIYLMHQVKRIKLPYRNRLKRKISSILLKDRKSYRISILNRMIQKNRFQFKLISTLIQSKHYLTKEESI